MGCLAGLVPGNRVWRHALLDSHYFMGLSEAKVACSNNAAWFGLDVLEIRVQLHELQSIAFSHFFTLIPSTLGLAVAPVLFVISFVGFHPSRSRPWVDGCRGLQVVVWGLAVVSVAK